MFYLRNIASSFQCRINSVPKFSTSCELMTGRSVCEGENGTENIAEKNKEPVGSSQGRIKHVNYTVNNSTKVL